MADDRMQINGARTHNLQNVSLEILKNALVVITGRSGSGKSSLAIDTIFAEGQRQFLESLSLYARQFFDQGLAIEVDAIVGLQPTICIDQVRGVSGPRSTVGTLTEIYDYLRLLYANVGSIHCWQCGQAVHPQTLSQICQSILQLGETKLMLLAPMVVGRQGKHLDVLERIRKERLVRVRVDGEIYDIDAVPQLSSGRNHTIEAITDRIVIRSGIENRLFESVELASKLSGGEVGISYQDAASGNWLDRLFSTKQACIQCGTSCPTLLPRSFSFNSPYGACPKCGGLGFRESFDIELVIPDWGRALRRGAVLPWNSAQPAMRRKVLRDLQPLLRELDVSTSQSLLDLSIPVRNRLLNSSEKHLPGILPLLEKEWVTCTDDDRREELAAFRGRLPCEECAGSRLNRQATSVWINEQSISQVGSWSLVRLADFLTSLHLDPSQQVVANPIVRDLQQRIRFLIKVGLDYLTLDRRTDTLSGGELQRVRLAKSIGSGLTGTCYILDEPTVGLHPRDTTRLIETLLELKQNGNSLIVVEHDESMMRAADQIIDLGPGAGSDGGQVIANGSYHDIISNADSLTGQYLSGRKSVHRKAGQRRLDSGWIGLRGAAGFNLKSIDVDFPTKRLTCVTGVSGSGKSTLIYKTLAPAFKQHFGLSSPAPEPYQSLQGMDQIDRIVEVDQQPISRTPRGCAATYTGILDDVRKIFAAAKTAKLRGFKANRFSFNTSQGWCPECQGYGEQRISMKFMPDVVVCCESCRGQRFNAATLSVRFRGLTIADVLQMSVKEALDPFANFARVAERLHSLRDVGLGYLPLGQASTTLSGGEAQRVKLATELSNANSGRTLYLLDEPTTGLHFEDIQLLLNVLTLLAEQGNTVIVIEHNLDLIRHADWVIDLGPEGGTRGGELIAMGSPTQIAQVASSYTGQALGDLKEA